MTRTKDEDERSFRPLTGGYYWFPAKVGNTVEWSVLSCHDLGFGPDEGHYDMWPWVIDRLATAWGRDPVQLRRRLAKHCYGLPRGRVTRPDRRYLLLHGADAPVADWLGRVVGRFHLDRRSLKLLSDGHEQTFSEDRRAINDEFGPLGGSPPVRWGWPMLTNLNINLVDASDGLVPKHSALRDRLRGTLVGHGVAMGSCGAYSVVMVPRWSGASRRPCRRTDRDGSGSLPGRPFPMRSKALRTGL